MIDNYARHVGHFYAGEGMRPSVKVRGTKEVVFFDSKGPAPSLPGPACEWAVFKPCRLTPGCKVIGVSPVAPEAEHRPN